MRGNTDKPISLLKEDEFQIEPYVKGLAEFIRLCFMMYLNSIMRH